MMSAHELIAAVDALLEEMIVHQRAKVSTKAQQLLPGCSWEEVMNPDGVPALQNDPLFNYEDGILAGTIAAQMALRAQILGPELRAAFEASEAAAAEPQAD